MKNKITFENQGSSTFLTYHLDSDDVVDTLTLGMLTNNKIPGLAETLYTQQDDKRFLKYNVSAKIPASDVFSRAVKKSKLIGFLAGVSEAALSAEEYMIDPDMLVLDPDLIYFDVSKNEATLLCVPVLKEDRFEGRTDLASYFKDIMVHTNFDEKENTFYVAKILNYLNKPNHFSLDEFIKLLEELDKMSAEEAPKAPVAPQPQMMAPPQPQAMPNPAMQAYPQSPAAPPMGQFPGPMGQPAPMPSQHPHKSRELNPGQLQGHSYGAAASASQSKPAKKAPEYKTNFAVPNRAQGGLSQKSDEYLANLTIDPAEEISFMYLMQHYNKENAAKYKEQKAIKKAKKKMEKMKGQNPSANNSKKKSKKNKKVQPTPNNYRVPGAPPMPMGQPQAQPYPMAQGPQTMPYPQGVPYPQTPQAPQPMPMAPQPMPQTPQAQAPSPAPMPESPAYSEPDPMILNQSMNSRSSEGFGETTILGGAGETTILGQGQTQTTPYLIRKKTKEKILLDKEVFRIGKEKSFVDYFVSDNSAISRSHANIVSRDGKVYLVDTNSTNHSYVEDEMVPSNQEVELRDGYLVRLANESFTFHME